MSPPVPPTLTVRHDGTERTFAAGHDVVVGRDLRADMRITHPLISRAHLLLRFDQGRWLAIDNNSLNGTYANGHRVPLIDISDGQSVNIGNPDGPLLVFEVGRHQGHAGRPPQTASMPALQPVAPGPAYGGSGPGPTSTSVRQPQWSGPPPPRQHPGAPPGPPPGQPMYPSSGAPAWPPPGYPVSGPPPSATNYPQAPPRQAPRPPMPPVGAKPPEQGNIATKMFQALRTRTGSHEIAPGSITLGRSTDNDIVIQDVLASRHHASLTLTPLGAEIRDEHSVNGTFVSGVRVGSAILPEGDSVPIGNVALVFPGGTLARRPAAASRTGGLEVN